MKLISHFPVENFQNEFLTTPDAFTIKSELFYDRTNSF